MRVPSKVMLFSTVNAGFETCFDGVAVGGLGVGVAFSTDLAASSIELAASSIETGDGEATTLGTGVDTGYLLLTSPPPPRDTNHAIRTPEAPSTRTIANTHGKTLLLDSSRVPEETTCAGLT